ncbi:MAG: hypothetical protein WAM92_19745 [Mycobacterium sp.]
MRGDPAPTATVPRWLRLVLISDRAGSSWYVGTGFFFAPALALVSPWSAVTAVLWVLIGLAGLWLGLLGIAMATGLAMVLRRGGEIPEEYWWSILDDSSLPAKARADSPAPVHGAPRRRRR